MEHRYYARRRTDLGTVLYRRGLPIATGRVSDASRGGVFVETDHPGLDRHQRLEFEYCIGTDRLRVTAHVLRRERRGIALEVDDTDSRTSIGIGTLLELNAPWSGPTTGPDSVASPGDPGRHPEFSVFELD